MVESKTSHLVDIVLVNKGKYDNGSFSFASMYSIFLFILLLISGVCLVVATMNGEVFEFKGMINLINNVVFNLHYCCDESGFHYPSMMNG